MAYKLIWSPAARDDLHDIVVFIARDNPNRAMSFGYELISETDRLQEFPELGREPEVMTFLKPVPTVWDETRVLAAKLGDYVCIARRKGPDWYIGAMTDWTSRTLEIDLSFLPAGRFQMLAYQDGPNAERMGHDYKATTSDVNKTTKLKIALAPGGGWAARISPRSADREDAVTILINMLNFEKLRLQGTRMSGGVLL